MSKTLLLLGSYVYTLLKHQCHSHYSNDYSLFQQDTSQEREVSDLYLTIKLNQLLNHPRELLFLETMAQSRLRSVV